MQSSLRTDLEVELVHARFITVPAALWAAAMGVAVCAALWERGTSAAPQDIEAHEAVTISAA